MSSVSSAVDDERREDGGENELQEDEVPITFSSIASSKVSSRKDRGGGGSSGGIEQVLIMMAENAANQTRLMEGFMTMRDNGPSKAVSSTDAFSHAHERNAYAKNVLALSSALCRLLTEKIKRESVLYQMYVKAKPTGSAVDQQKFLEDIFIKLAPSTVSEDCRMMASLALEKRAPSGFSDLSGLVTAVELLVLHANLNQSKESLFKIESMFCEHLSSPTLQFYQGPLFLASLPSGTSVIQKIVLFRAFCLEQRFDITLTSDSAASSPHAYVATIE